MSNPFDNLLDRHLTLSERIRQPNPEQAVTEIEGLIASMDDALDAGSITGPSARRISSLSGYWRSYLATVNSKPAVTPAAVNKAASTPLVDILRSMSTQQYWIVGGALVTLILGAVAVGRYEAILSNAEKLSGATIEATAQKARADTITLQLDEKTKRLDLVTAQVDTLQQERLLLELIATIRDHTNAKEAVAARKQLGSLLQDMQQKGLVTSWSGSGVQRIEVKRTGEVWLLAAR